MRYSLLFLLVFGLISLGYSNSQAGTRDQSNTAQSGSSDQSANQTSGASPSNTMASASSDQKFVEDAIKGNRAEVTLGKMVAAKAQDQSVKQFAQLMVKDHSHALNELEQLARKKGLNVPAGLPDDAQQLQSKLQSDSGKQLDKDYMEGMVNDHQKDVQEFQDAAQNAKDPEVKQLASKLLPTLQQHLDKAKQVHSKVSGGRS
jgi:putative membrane protein